MAVTIDPIGSAFRRINYTSGMTITQLTDAIEDALDGVIPAAEMGWTSLYTAATRVNGTTSSQLVFSAPCAGVGAPTKYVKFHIRGGNPGYIRIACGTAYYAGEGTTAADDYITSTGNTCADGDKISFHKSSAAVGIDITKEYFVVESTTNKFKIALTRGASAVDLSGVSNVSFVTLRDQNYDCDCDANTDWDWESQPFQTNAVGALNIWATNRWLCIYGATVAGGVPRIGGKTSFWWQGVFEVKKEDPNDAVDNGLYAFGFIQGKRFVTDATHNFCPPQNYWGELDINSSYYTGLSTAAGFHGQGPSNDGTTLVGDPGGLGPTKQRFLFPGATYQGWALDIRVWEHGPYTTPVDSVCIGRIYGLKVAIGNQGTTGSTVSVKTDSDYLYDASGVALDHEVITNYSSYKQRFLLPKNIYSAP